MRGHELLRGVSLSENSHNGESKEREESIVSVLAQVCVRSFTSEANLACFPKGAQFGGRG